MFCTDQLRLDPDSGSVYRRIPDGDDEWVGHIDDDDACPMDLIGQWTFLRGEIEDARRLGDGIKAAALHAFYASRTPREW